MKHKLGFFISLLWFLSLAILGAIYGTWFLYPKAIELFQLEKVTFLTKTTIAYNFNQLMAYLTNPLVTRLQMANFTSSRSGLAHFQAVKLLFHLVQGLAVVLSLPSYFFFKKRDVLPPFLLKRFMLWVMGLPVLILIFAALVGFDQFFVLFHQILFPGDTSWLFDPLTDPVIWILPQELFLQAFVLFFVLYQGLMGLYWYLLSRKR